MKQHHVIMDTKKCIGCGLCAKTCVAHNINIVNKKAETVIDDCLMCGQCSAICPKQAITVSGYEVQQIENTKQTKLNPVDILDVIHFRRSIRQFKQQEIPDDIIQQILEAGRLTHTAKNMQDVSFIVLHQDKKRIEEMAVGLFRKLKPFINIFSKMARMNTIDDNFFFFQAPIAIMICAKDKTNGLLAAQNMEFVAEAHGLGVLYSGYFTMAANHSHNIKKAVNLPKGKKVAMTLVLGYPNVKFLRSTPHKKLDVTYK